MYSGLFMAGETKLLILLAAVLHLFGPRRISGLAPCSGWVHVGFAR
jgi:Sec-independent protein translocase protein TatA